MSLLLFKCTEDHSVCITVNHKYDWNRQDRRTARKDVPMARVCETEEEERRQREAMDRMERNRQLLVWGTFIE